MSKHPKQYKQHVSQVIAAEQLIKEGAEIHAGNSIKFLFTHAEDKRYDRRVMATQLIEKGVKTYTKKYLMPLFSSAANPPRLGRYPQKIINDAIQGQSQRR